MDIYRGGCRDPNDPSCINQTRNGTLSPFWEWTKRATYEGTTVIREREYDQWSYVVSERAAFILIMKVWTFSNYIVMHEAFFLGGGGGGFRGGDV